MNYMCYCDLIFFLKLEKKMTIRRGSNGFPWRVFVTLFLSLGL